ncbi:GGDEF domain-containing protein [Polymorphum gilvum]|uniref:diguanylate cyclase n=1 Tax=Polymorphum gilvum (strain LMG 25793 / CGMCC 1.9160 / SL003B-26A1) TaxID=991905 RepID=F2J002_POLGS|nr:GGDEF domain-containing protein [Polymorphum gilvum]ADZ71837.1 Putative diguanylate cyclase (GGDEF domain) [Polymorphum gilvum SL003B-26A1]
MPLDTATLNAAITVIGFVGAVLLFLVWRFSMGSSSTHRDSILIWAAAFMLIGCGTLIVGLRNHLPETFSIVAGNALIMLGIGLRRMAVAAFWHLKRRHIAAIAPAVVWLALCLVPEFLGSYTARAIFVQVYLILIPPWIAYMCFAHNRENLYSGFWFGISALIDFAVNLSLFVAFRIAPVTSHAEAMQNDIYKGYMLIMIVTAVASVILAFAMVIEREERRLRIQARRDPLTGLANRRAFFEQAQDWLDRHAATPKTFSVALFDLDDFKSVNDRFGHAAGDEMLTTFAEVCRERLRPGDLAGRLGGEEFVLFLPDTPADAALVLADRLRHAFAQAAETRTGGTLAATTSAGVHGGRCGEDDLDRVLAVADAALYSAKRAGRNQVVRSDAGQPPETAREPGLAPVRRGLAASA